MAGLAWFLALVLASSAIQKLLERDRMSMAAAKLAAVGLGLAAPLSLVAAALEAMAAVALLFPATQMVGALIAAGVWLGYGVALAAAARRGDSLDCGCSFAMRRKPVDAFTIARPFILAGFAGMVFVAAAAGATLPGVEPVFAALGLFTLYHAAGEIAALPSPHRKVAS
jgi:hypothetical protein